MRQLLLLFILLGANYIMPARAQDDHVPGQVLLEGFTWLHQGVNRCSAAALTIQISYFSEVTADTYYEFARQDLNTWGADASVRIEEMAHAIQERGFGAVVRRGGTIDLMKQLLAGGFPVLVENSYYEGSDLHRDWLSHNRVLIGYDDAQGIFSFQDPLLGYPDGEIVTYTYDDFDMRWRPFNRDYLVIYALEDEAQVQAILGDQWDEQANANHVLAIAQAEIADGQADAFAYHNQGWAQLQLGMIEAAATSYDQARSLRLPWRMLWYEFGIFEAYLAAQRYEDVITLVNTQLANVGSEVSVEEWFYYAGQAYEGLGNPERAITNYQLAVVRNNNYVEAAERLTALQTP